jgi:hypothetical protein
VVLTTRFTPELDGRAGSALRWHDAERMMEVDVPSRAAKLLVQLASLRLALPERRCARGRGASAVFRTRFAAQPNRAQRRASTEMLRRGAQPSPSAPTVHLALGEVRCVVGRRSRRCWPISHAVGAERKSHRSGTEQLLHALEAALRGRSLCIPDTPTWARGCLSAHHAWTLFAMAGEQAREVFRPAATGLGSSTTTPSSP